MTHTVVVCGATGHVGKALTLNLLEKGIKVRGVARTPGNLESIKNPGFKAHPGDMLDKDFLISVFKGADAVFALSPPLYNLPDFMEVLRKISVNTALAAKTNGINKIVLLSSVGAELPSGTGQIACLHEFENMLKDISGVSAVSLRSTYYMENFINSIPLIKSAGITGGIFNPDTSFGMIATQDVAGVAAEYLSALDFEGFNVHYLLGPKNYTHSEAATILGTSIDKPDLQYVKITTEEFKKGLTGGAGFSSNAAEALTEAFTALDEKRIGQYERTTSNTTPTTLGQFATEVFAKLYNQF